jgi:hypothetical protein
MRANDFMVLSALLRNFCAPSARDREALLGVEGRSSVERASQRGSAAAWIGAARPGVLFAS